MATSDIGKGAYLIAKNKDTGEIEKKTLIPPAPSDGDLGGISEEELAQITTNKEKIASLNEELIDGRTDVDGNVHDNIGDSMRGQTRKLRENLVVRQKEQPTDPNNNVWISDEDDEVEVPDMGEFNSLKEDLVDYIYYPFSKTITDKSMYDTKAIIDCKIYNADASKGYLIAVLSNTQISIYENGDNHTIGKCVCYWSNNTYVGSGKEIIILNETKNSGIYGYIIIDWDKLQNNFFSRNDYSALLSDKCYINNINNDENVFNANLYDPTLTWVDGTSNFSDIACGSGKLYGKNTASIFKNITVSKNEELFLTAKVDFKVNMGEKGGHTIIGISEDNNSFSENASNLIGISLFSQNDYNRIYAWDKKVDDSSEVELTQDDTIYIDIQVDNISISLHAYAEKHDKHFYHKLFRKQQYNTLGILLSGDGENGTAITELRYTEKRNLVQFEKYACLYSVGWYSKFRVYTPVNYNGEKTYNAIICFHGSGGNEASWDNSDKSSSYYKAWKAFIDSGYIVVTVCESAGTTLWGNKYTKQAYTEAYNYLMNNYNINDIGIFCISMGGISSLNTIAYNNMNIKAWIGISITYNLEDCANGRFSEAIKSAYNIGTSDYEQKTKDNDPSKMPNYTYAKMPMKIIVGTTDESINYQNNGKLLYETVNNSIICEYTEVENGGHEFDLTPYISDILAFYSHFLGLN